jgi:DNA-directed RNA polymerase specialized sigma24 family protein
VWQLRRKALHVQRSALLRTLSDMEGSGPDDRNLVDAFLEDGDEEAFRRLFRRHTPALHAFCLRLVGASLAEDAVQETWLRASRKLGSFAWRSSLRTWLTGIALNCAREALREERPLQTAGPADTPLAPGPPEGDLEKALGSLPPGYREVLVLHDVQGFTHSEIAEQMGIEVSTSRCQLVRARRALKVRWAPPPGAIRSTGKEAV